MARANLGTALQNTWNQAQAGFARRDQNRVRNQQYSENSRLQGLEQQKALMTEIDALGGYRTRSEDPNAPMESFDFLKLAKEQPAAAIRVLNADPRFNQATDEKGRVFQTAVSGFDFDTATGKVIVKVTRPDGRQVPITENRTADDKDAVAQIDLNDFNTLGSRRLNVMSAMGASDNGASFYRDAQQLESARAQLVLNKAAETPGLGDDPAALSNFTGIVTRATGDELKRIAADFDVDDNTIKQAFGIDDPAPLDAPAPSVAQAPQGANKAALTDAADAPAESPSTNQPIDKASLYASVEQVESGGEANPDNALSSAGARGPMQLMPGTAKDPGYGIEPAKDDSPEENRRVGQQYLDALVKKYDGNLDHALAAYNWGPGNTDKWIAAGADLSKLPEETRNYIPKVRKLMGLSDAPAADAPAADAPAAPFLRDLPPNMARTDESGKLVSGFTDKDTGDNLSVAEDAPSIESSTPGRPTKSPLQAGTVYTQDELKQYGAAGLLSKVKALETAQRLLAKQRGANTPKAKAAQSRVDTLTTELQESFDQKYRQVGKAEEVRAGRPEILKSISLQKQRNYESKVREFEEALKSPNLSDARRAEIESQRAALDESFKAVDYYYAKEDKEASEAAPEIPEAESFATEDDVRKAILDSAKQPTEEQYAAASKLMKDAGITKLQDISKLKNKSDARMMAWLMASRQKGSVSQRMAVANSAINYIETGSQSVNANQQRASDIAAGNYQLNLRKYKDTAAKNNQDLLNSLADVQGEFIDISAEIKAGTLDLESGEPIEPSVETTAKLSTLIEKAATLPRGSKRRLAAQAVTVEALAYHLQAVNASTGTGFNLASKWSNFWNKDGGIRVGATAVSGLLRLETDGQGNPTSVYFKDADGIGEQNFRMSLSDLVDTYGPDVQNLLIEVAGRNSRAESEAS